MPYDQNRSSYLDNGISYTRIKHFYIESGSSLLRAEFFQLSDKVNISCRMVVWWPQEPVHIEISAFKCEECFTIELHFYEKTNPLITNKHIGCRPPNISRTQPVNSDNAICMLRNMIHMSHSNQHCAWRWPCGHLAPRHIQSSWHRPVGAYHECPG